MDTKQKTRAINKIKLKIWQSFYEKSAFFGKMALNQYIEQKQYALKNKKP